MTAARFVLLILLLLALSFLVQLAVAKYLYERKIARRKREEADPKEGDRPSEGAGGGP